MPARRSALSGSASWMEIWMCSRPASRKAVARSRVRPTPEVTSVVYSPSPWACAASTSRSLRASGSPPESPSCSTPSSRASVKTLVHSSVLSSPSAPTMASGFEQYGQCSGHRWVSSASSVVGRLAVTDELLLGELGQILGDIGGDVAVVALLENRRDLAERPAAVAEPENRRTRLVQQDRAFRVQQDGLL